MVEGNEELEQQHSGQTEKLAQGMVENRKQGHQRRLDHDDLVGAHRYQVTRLPGALGKVLIHVCCPRIIINAPFSLTKCPSLDDKIYDLPPYRERNRLTK